MRRAVGTGFGVRGACVWHQGCRDNAPRKGSLNCNARRSLLTVQRHTLGDVDNRQERRAAADGQSLCLLCTGCRPCSDHCPRSRLIIKPQR
jgi:hypothetical protein